MTIFFYVRGYTINDFSAVQSLNVMEGWNTLAEKQAQTMAAWNHSNIAFVICKDDEVIGYIRGLTDGFVTMFISELLINRNYRGFGIGTELLKYIHNHYPEVRIDLLGANTSKSYYENQKFRSFYGFRKTYDEWL